MKKLNFFILSFLIFSNTSSSNTENSSVFTITITEIATTYQDNQSSGSPRLICQNPNTPSEIHLTYTMLGSPSGVTDVRYHFSQNRGTNWMDKGSLGSGLRLRFPCISILSDGSAAIMAYGSFNNQLVSYLFIDVQPGGGSFTNCPINAANILWPHFIPTASQSLPVKIVYVSSRTDSAYINKFTSLSSCQTTGNTLNQMIKPVHGYNLSRGADGRIGLAYIANPYLNPNQSGNVFLMESTDNGVNFNSPVQIWQTNFSTDSMGAARGIDIVYISNTPYVTFDVTKLTPGGQILPNRPSKIMLWSPSVNGGSPVMIDSAGGTSSASDIYSSVARPVIGTTSQLPLIYVAWNKARTETFNSVNYFDIYFAFSMDGLLWNRTRVTNNSGPLRDCRYVSISQYNAAINPLQYEAHLLYLADSVPGAQSSLAKVNYANIKFQLSNLNPVGSEIPETFSLYQNFPNPFNPVTRISFDVPASTEGITPVEIAVYDVQGRKISTLINSYLKPGRYELSWHAKDYPSGIYFCKMNAGSFSSSRKMILAK
ncbi:MAG: T9SS type A sorting domain-containing protein [Ignavibacteria bacterium]|nr:T9SS type A sorting domain-containing protein [Ignavibacteria bacterium]